MRKWLMLLLGVLALGLVAAGCGGDDNESSGTPAPAEQPADGGAASGGGSTVAIKDFAFGPADLKVAKGDTVTWTNEDSAGHDVTGDAFKSGEPGGMAQSDTFEHTFKEAGSFDYVCTVHANMKGTVTVQ